MLAAAKRAEADEFVGGLTDPKGRNGYDAHVGAARIDRNMFLWEYGP
jgi:hypothetical protein